MLEIKDLHVEIEGKEVIKGLNFSLEKGKVNVLMGPNGSGKSTLANVLMGNPKYKVTSGKIFFKGKDITEMSPDERAKMGMFLSFQYPTEVEGAQVSNFLRQAYNSLHEEQLKFLDFKKLIDEKANMLHMDKELITRYLNQGFSGGEKKKSEILQMLVLQPSFVILDETDSGTDADALRIIAEGIDAFFQNNAQEKCVLLITHYNRILRYLKPHKVFVMIDGKIVKEGEEALAHEIDEHGYRELRA